MMKFGHYQNTGNLCLLGSVCYLENPVLKAGFSNSMIKFAVNFIDYESRGK